MIPKHALQLVEAIRMTGHKLTTNENGLLATVHVTAKSNRLISDRQANFLQDIYSKVSGASDYQSREYIG